MPSVSIDIAIIGAGPYGLAAAAHLRSVRGIEVLVFGEPMSFWDRHMPIGMFLRSNWTATQIADPSRSLTLESYQSASGNLLSSPVPLDRFVEYGLWYQQRAVPDLERRKVIRLESCSKGFRLTLGDGGVVHSRRVIVAAGIGAFTRRPEEFHGFPSSLVTHSSEHRDFSCFSQRRILVIGGGQSALESGALLHEAGAVVEIISRSHRIHWLGGWASRTLHQGLGKFVRNLLYAPTDVGPAGISQLAARPDLVRRLPRRIQNKLWRRAVRPAGAGWLWPRLRKVPVRFGLSPVAAVPHGEQITVGLSDGSERTVDHVLLGTGYRVDIARYEFWAPELLAGIDRFNGYPILKPGFETSVPGLHILGAPAAWSFGPLMQFVSGTAYASRSLLRSTTGRQIAPL